MRRTSRLPAVSYTHLQIIAPVNVGNFLSLPTLEILPGGEELLPQMDELSRAFQARCV